MPSPSSKWYELNQFTVTADQQMRRYLEAANLTKVRMRIPVQPIGKKIFNL